MNILMTKKGTHEVTLKIENNKLIAKCEDGKKDINLDNYEIVLNEK